MVLAVDLVSLRQSCPTGLCLLFQRDVRLESVWTRSVGLSGYVLAGVIGEVKDEKNHCFAYNTAYLHGLDPN